MDRNLNHPRDSKEALLAAFAGIIPVIPNAGGQRETLYLAKIQGQDVQLPETDWTRTEMYLRAIAENGGGGSVGMLRFTGNGSTNITIPDLVGKDLIAAILVDPLAFPVESLPTFAISLVKGDWYGNGGEYAAIMGLYTRTTELFHYDVIAGSYLSRYGFLNFNARLISGKRYAVFYK